MAKIQINLLKRFFSLFENCSKISFEKKNGKNELFFFNPKNIGI